MKIFADNIESLKQDIDLLRDKFGITRSQDLAYQYGFLAELCIVMKEMGFKPSQDDIRFLNNSRKYINLYEKKISNLKRKKVKDFIKNKENHYNIASKLVTVCDREFEYRNLKPLYLQEDQMAEIICNFLNDEFNQADQFIKMAKNGQIFRFGIGEEEEERNTTAYTIYNYMNDKTFISVSTDPMLKDVCLMKNIVHEFGHAADALDRRSISKKDNFLYDILSDYSEVYSILYEKLFLDYLIKNKIFKSNAHTELVILCNEIYEKINNLGYISTLDDELLINQKYQKRIDDITKEERETFKDNPDLNGILEYVNSAIASDFNEINIYSYGGIFAFYFSYLKHNDSEMFNKMFNAFKNKRFNTYDPRIFKTIGTSEDEIVKIYSECLDRINGKKLILK